MTSSGPRVGLTMALLGWGLVAGCAPQRGDEPPPVIETEEVGPGLDAEVDLSSDRKAAARDRSGGKLPGSFPEGLPVYKPSNISDLGPSGSGEFVQFMSQSGVDAVRGWYPGALRNAGWSVESGPGGELLAVRDQRRALILIERSGPITLIRVEY